MPDPSSASGGTPVHTVSVEWSLGKEPDVILEIWNTAALVEAVLAALLEDPAAMARGLEILRATM